MEIPEIVHRAGAFFAGGEMPVWRMELSSAAAPAIITRHIYFDTFDSFAQSYYVLPEAEPDRHAVNESEWSQDGSFSADPDDPF